MSSELADVEKQNGKLKSQLEEMAIENQLQGELCRQWQQRFEETQEMCTKFEKKCEELCGVKKKLAGMEEVEEMNKQLSEELAKQVEECSELKSNQFELQKECKEQLVCSQRLEEDCEKLRESCSSAESARMKEMEECQLWRERCSSLEGAVEKCQQWRERCSSLEAAVEDSRMKNSQLEEKLLLAEKTRASENGEKVREHVLGCWHAIVLCFVRTFGQVLVLLG